MAAPVGSSAGPHGALVAGYGRVAPAPRAGFNTVGTGTGKWLYVPKAPAKPADPAPAAASPLIAANSPLLNPNQTLSGPALLQAAQGIADAQTQGPISEIAAQIAQNNRQSQGAINQVGGYYNQLGNQAKQGVSDEQGIASGLNSQLQGIGSDEQNALAGIGQNATQSLMAHAPQSDQAQSLASPALQALQAEIARQQGIAAQSQGAQRSFGATQGANYGSLAASNLGTFALKGQEALRGIAQNAQVKNEPLTAKIAALQATRGADLATAVGKLRQQEISNRIANTGLGIKEQANLISQGNNVRNNQTSSANNVRTTSTSASNNAATNATSRANNAANNNPNAVGSPAWARVQNASGKDWSNNPAAVGSPAWARAQKGSAAQNGGNAKPLSTLENNHFWQTIGQLEQLIQDGQAKGQQGKINGFLQDGQNPSKRSFDPFLIQVADELLGYGSINQATADQLKNGYGVNLGGGTFRGKPIKVTANYTPPPVTPQNPLGAAKGIL